jgi:hypothetical protein
MTTEDLKKELGEDEGDKETKERKKWRKKRNKLVELIGEKGDTYVYRTGDLEIEEAAYVSNKQNGCQRFV